MTAPVTVADDRAATVTCPGTLLAPGATLTCTATYTVTQADLERRLGRQHGDGDIGHDDVAARHGHRPRRPRRRSSISTRPPSPITYDHVGHTITYTYTITNDSDATLNGPFTVTDDQTTVTCPSSPAWRAKRSVTCTATYTITQADLDAGSGHQPRHSRRHVRRRPGRLQPRPDDRRGDQGPGADRRQVRHPGTYDHVGQVLSYTYLVTNTGNVTMTSPVTVTDDRVDGDLPAGPARTRGQRRPAPPPTRSPRTTSTPAR